MTGAGRTLLFAALLGSISFAQVLTGTLTGIVTDPTDAVIPGANVTATDLATGKDYQQSTDSEGAFTFTNLPNGFFRVAVEHAGFAKTELDRVQIFVSQVS